MPASGGEPKKATFDSAGDRSPAFSADGKKLYFLRSEGGDFLAGERPQTNLMVALLEKQDKDPDEAAAATSDAADNSPEAAQRRATEQRRAAEALNSPKPPTIDWAGLKRRTRSVLRTSSGRGGRGGGATSGLSVISYTPARDGRTLHFAASSGSGASGGVAIYTCTDDGRGLRQLASAATPAA